MDMISKMRALFLIISSITLVKCHPPHPAVVAVRQEEERLPPYLRSQALHNPHLQQILPLTSLLHDGENLVYERESDNVPRQEIYNILTHAGFLPRRPGHYKLTQYRMHRHRPSAHHQNDLINDNYLDFFSDPELLQHL
ncbi:hypothetical protein evm_012427 [Chilo suppressalis]|nr:hypothetical protein evm_012427 [Chilo suppressalis]